MEVQKKYSELEEETWSAGSRRRKTITMSKKRTLKWE